MKVTDIRFRGEASGRFVSYATVIFDGEFALHNLRLVRLEGSGRMMLSMPRRQREDGSWIDVAHPIHQEFRKYLEDQIFSAYEQFCLGATSNGHDRTEAQ